MRTSPNKPDRWYRRCDKPGVRYYLNNKRSHFFYNLRDPIKGLVPPRR